MKRLFAAATLLAMILGIGLMRGPAIAFDKAESENPATRDTAASKSADPAVPLNRNKTVLIDKKGGRVLLKSKVVLREGLLEMLCCIAQTKEHEAVLSVDAKAYVIHAALIALGADPGTPVQFSPDFKQPTGPKVDIFLNWTDEKGKAHRVKAQTWVRHAVRRYYVAKMEKLPEGLELPKKGELTFDAKHGELLWYNHMTKEQREKALALSKDAKFREAINRFYEESQPREMEADFVFAGSQFHKDDQTGEEFYAAEGGDLLCVANFPSAMIDVAMESSSTGTSNLLFEPYTDRIPPVDTPVTIELIPVAKKAKAGEVPKKPAPKDQAPKK